MSSGDSPLSPELHVGYLERRLAARAAQARAWLREQNIGPGESGPLRTAVWVGATTGAALDLAARAGKLGPDALRIQIEADRAEARDAERRQDEEGMKTIAKEAERRRLDRLVEQDHRAEAALHRRGIG